jgi:hypothetical protein
MNRAVRGLAAASLAIFLTPPAQAAGPPPLSRDSARLDVASTYGSGAFGRWHVDRFGLPAYRYAIDEARDPIARQPELNGRTDAWHQLGNDRIVANAYNHGYVQLWSQERRYQWTNRFDPATGHSAAGFGYLRVGGRTVRSSTGRDFGVGYARRRGRAAGVDVEEHVYAPFGDDPLLLHDVTIRNTSRARRRVTWFEPWDVNPYDQAAKRPLALERPSYDRARRTLSVRQAATPDDPRPLTIFAAALRGPVSGHTTGAANATRFTFRAPLTLRPGEAVTLRYAYGITRAPAIAGLVRRYRAERDPLRASQRAWAAWLPRIRFGAGRAWLSRELQWDAYQLRSGTTYEECRGRHVVSQGGYYQYDFGFQGAFRDPLQHVLPLIYAAPEIARDTLLYSAQEQPRNGAIPYALSALCKRLDLGTSADPDLWLLLTAAEYGLATRDLRTFGERVRFEDGSTASLWEHLRVAYRRQESKLRLHGGYDAGTNGDWSDFSTRFLGMTESLLVTAQVAYVYPRLAELAALRGDRAFAGELRAAGARALATVRREWTGRWYARGYAGDRRIGTGAIFGEPQPWAILAGAPSAEQGATLVRNIRRFLTGVGAPGGPARIGSSQSPARNDPEVTERTEGGIGGNNAVFVGGSWYAVNGWLVWALGRLGATDAAFDEFERNTLAAHAAAYPRHWNGITSVDDVCHSFYSPQPNRCGIGLTTGYAGQIAHQPAWSLFDAIKLAGVEPTARGYTIRPSLPMRSFSLRLPEVGVAYERGRARGYVRVRGTRTLTMTVAAPARGKLAAYVGGRHVRLRRVGDLVRFRLSAVAGRAVDWALARR